MKALILPTLALLVMASANVYGQCDCPVETDDGWCWGTDPGVAKEKQALLQDNVENKSYAEAEAPLEWILENIPGMNLSIYQHAATIYFGLYKSSTDKAKKKEYIEKLIAVYYKRVECYGEREKVINLIGLYLPAKGLTINELYDFYKECFELNQENTHTSNFKTFTNVVGKRKNNMKDEYTTDQVMADYDMITALLAKRSAAQGDAEKKKIKDIQDFYDNALCQMIKCDCTFAKEVLWPKLKEDESNLPLAAKVERFMREECKLDPIYLEVLLVLWESDDYKTWQTARSMKLLYKVRAKQLKEEGLIHESTEAIKQSDEWREKTIDLIEMSEDASDEDKAELYFDKAKDMMYDNKYSEARALFNKVAKLDNNLSSECYSFIANMYMQSGGMCTGDPIAGKACYYAAYNMYQRAGNSAGMSNAKKQFPLPSEIFMTKHKEGDEVPVGCWIGGTVKIMAR